MVYATNRKASHDYEILDKLEAGLVLAGHEVKAIKSGKCSIAGAYVKIVKGALQIIGATVSPYQPKNTPKDYDPMRSRVLLVKKTELSRLVGKTQEKGITMVPLALYAKGGLIKLEIGIARGKKKYDKRDVLKKREFTRERERMLKRS